MYSLTRLQKDIHILSDEYDRVLDRLIVNIRMTFTSVDCTTDSFLKPQSSCKFYLSGLHIGVRLMY